MQYSGNWAEDVRRVFGVLSKRLGKYGLQLHPDKTRVVDCRIPRRWPPRVIDRNLPTSFNFLGFTHVWGRSRWGMSADYRVTSTLFEQGPDK